MVDDTLVYILLLTRHIRKGDVSSAVLALLVELGFTPGADGFGYLRKAILLKYNNPDMRCSELYSEVGCHCHPEAGNAQVERAIRTAVDAAWKNGNAQEWSYFFINRKSSSGKPTNGDFISTIACVMELWCNSCKEECYDAD